MARVLLDEWHLRVEADGSLTDTAVDAVLDRLAVLIAGAARTIEAELRQLGGGTIRVEVDR